MTLRHLLHTTSKPLIPLYICAEIMRKFLIILFEDKNVAFQKIVTLEKGCLFYFILPCTVHY
jgi:hypothetical protein